MSTNKGIYTYDDFERKVQEYGFTPDQISDADRQLAKSNADAGIALLGYKNDWLNADNESAKAMAHAAAEDIRSRYGNYSGGGDGGSFTLTGTADHEDPWEQTIKSTVRNLKNRKFEWSPETDPTVKYYEDAYRREGERAMKDTLGALAAMTGGNASSYASAAAAQQRNYYAQQLTDKYPELYQQAYENFLKEYDREYQLLDAYVKMSDTDYTRWNDQQERDRQARQDSAAAVQQAFENQLALDKLAQGSRQLDITEKQYGEQNKIAWAEIGLKDKDMQQKYELAYAQLNQDDRHFVDDLLYRYNVMTEEGKQFWAKLAQDGKIADAELQHKYDALDQGTKNFLMEYALDVEKLEFEKDVHADETALAQQQIDYNWERLKEDARQFDISTERAKIIAEMEDQLARDKITASKDAEKLEMAKVAASYGDFSALKALGYDVSTYEAIYNKKMAEELNPTTEEEGSEEDVIDSMAGQTGNTFGSSQGRPSKKADGTWDMNVLLAKEKEGRPLSDEEKAALAVYHKTMGHIK